MSLLVFLWGLNKYKKTVYNKIWNKVFQFKLGMIIGMRKKNKLKCRCASEYYRYFPPWFLYKFYLVWRGWVSSLFNRDEKIEPLKVIWVICPNKWHGQDLLLRLILLKFSLPHLLSLPKPPPSLLLTCIFFGVQSLMNSLKPLYHTSQSNLLKVHEVLNTMKYLFDNMVKQLLGGSITYTLVEIKLDLSVKGYCSHCKMLK